jgi:predicted house-cleaning noncanonical NTP pyrophosphatase (MazG superfamily)
MSYLPETGGQREAVAYLNRIGKKLRRPLRVGGHSKGGNFAVYASAFCDKSVRDRIIAVYSNDAPGFRKEVAESEEYRAVIEKVKSIVPESSVIGLLLSSEAAHKYTVASSVKGMLQHDGMTWQVKRNEFVQTEQSDFGRFIRDTQKDWLSKIDDRSREKYVSALFSLLESTGADTFIEMKGQKLKTIEQILTSAKELPEETQKLILDITGELIGSSGRTIRQALADLKQEKDKLLNKTEGKEE